LRAPRYAGFAVDRVELGLDRALRRTPELGDLGNCTALDHESCHVALGRSEPPIVEILVDHLLQCASRHSEVAPEHLLPAHHPDHHPGFQKDCHGQRDGGKYLHHSNDIYRVQRIDLDHVLDDVIDEKCRAQGLRDHQAGKSDDLPGYMLIDAHDRIPVSLRPRPV